MVTYIGSLQEVIEKMAEKLCDNNADHWSQVEKCIGGVAKEVGRGLDKERNSVCQSDKKHEIDHDKDSSRQE